MDKEFIPYEQALALKELGFDEPCLAQYKKYDVGEATLDIGFSKNEIIMQFHKLSKFCSASLYQQAFRWFREKYDLHENVGIKHFIEKTYCYSIVSTSIPHYIHNKSHFASYEEAELECLKELIEIVKT